MKRNRRTTKDPLVIYQILKVLVLVLKNVKSCVIQFKDKLVNSVANCGNLLHTINKTHLHLER